jgi:hypothetical protein
VTDEPASVGSQDRNGPPPRGLQATPPRERARAPGKQPRWRAEALVLLELAAVAGVALAQPLLDVIGKSPDFFLFYGAGRREALLLVATVVLVPPLALWGIGLLAGLIGPRVRAGVHLGTLGGLLALLAVQVGKQALPLRGLPLVGVAVVAGTALAAAYWRWEAAKQLVRLAAIGPVVFTLLFVFASPASAVVLGGGDDAGGAGGDATGPHPPLVLLVLDELPTLSLLDGHGRIDAARYPNFARLAGGSTWYRNATGVSGWTPYAVPAMLSGRYPTEQVAPHYSQHPRNLFTLLGSRYDLKVQESITQLCPPRSCDRDAARRGGLSTMLGESATLLSEIVSPEDTRRDPTASFAEPTVAEDDEPPPTDPKFRWDTLDDNQPVRFRQFVTGLAAAPDNRPDLHFLHLLLPHTPWRYLPSGMRYDAPEDLPTGGSRWWPQLARQRHLLQLQYADRLLGETLDALRASGTYDESLIVLTADHGVSFAPDSVGRGMGHVEGSPAEVLWVPTFVKAPGQRAGGVDDRNWQHVDLLPTIASYAGVRLPWRVDGVSARGPARAGTDKLFYDSPTAKVTIDGAAGLRVVTGRTSGIPRLESPPRPELIGRATAEFRITGGGPRVTVANAAAFASVSPEEGRLPALVYGSLPSSVPVGSVLAIAVNGRIGAVVPAQAAGRFAGIVADPAAFHAGRNALELFLVEGEMAGESSLRRLPL